MLEPLLRTAAAAGLDLDVSSSKALADSLDHAVVRCTHVFNFSFVYVGTVTLVRFFFELFSKIVLSYACDGMRLIGQLETSNIYLAPF